MYETGLLLAVAIWFIRAIYALLQINSTLEKNINKIGKRQSWLDFTIKPLTSDYVNKSVFYKIIKYLLIWGLIPFILIFTSWLYVIYVVAVFAYKTYQNIGMPNNVKEYKWRLRNLNLSFNDLVQETVAITNNNEITFEEAREAIIEEMKSNGLHAYNETET